MKNPRKIDLIVVHCSATRVNKNFTVEQLEACHKARGFKSIGICYEGGLDKNGNPADTRTPEQKKTMEDLLYGLAIDYPDAEILGHCDLPGVRKACPSFDVATWLAEINFGL